MTRKVKASGRKASPERSKIFARYGGFANVCAWDKRAKELGSAVPWNDGPTAVQNWMVKHGKNPPTWLALIIESEETTALASVAAGAPETPAEWSGDHVGFMDSLLAELRKRGERARASGNDSVITLIGKEYSKLAVAREIAAKASRAGDDGLIPLRIVLDTVDAIHAAIPDRIEAALLGSEAEARAALDAGEWRGYCGRFRRHALGELSERGFDVILKTETKPKQ